MQTIAIKSKGKPLSVIVTVGAVVLTSLVAAAPARAAELGTLTLKSNSGGQSGTATAGFATPAKGRSVALEALTIPTKNTTETTTAVWRKIATAKQDASGKAVFAFNPLEVAHDYRARTYDPVAKTDVLTKTVQAFAADRNTKNDGLATAYFDTYEGHSVNTRTRYFEGQFSMTGSTQYGACNAVAGGSGGDHATMKGRGNYSWSFPKKSFTLKLDKGIDLCGMGKSKKWALVAAQYDKSLLRTDAAFYIGSKLTNLAWTPKVTPVDLYVNGSYRGLYQLVERITIDKDRVNAGGSLSDAPEDQTEPNLSGGYLLEWDFRANDGGSSAPDHSINLGTRGRLGIKEPEDGDKVTGTELKYIRSYVNKADDVLFGGGYRDNATGWQKYIDKSSAVDFYIGQELTKPIDGNMWASVYMYKARNGKLFMGPMWDYDLALGSANRAGGTASAKGFYLRNSGCLGKPTCKDAAKQSSTTWFNRLNQDPEFRAAVRARYAQLYAALGTTDDHVKSTKSKISAAASVNFKKWSVKEHLSTRQVVKGSWSKETTYLTGWLNSRQSWLKKSF